MMNEMEKEVQVQEVNENKGKNKKQKMEYVIEGDVAKFTTSQGVEFMVDAEDAERVAEYCWYVNNRGYVQGRVAGKKAYLHRLIMGVLDSEDKTLIVDHRDGRKFNNSKSNLRLCNHQQNNRNTKAKGYHELPNGKYESYIYVDGEKIHLGHYNTLEHAKAVRIMAEKEHFGDFSSNKHLFDDPETLRLYNEAMETVKRNSKYNEYTINGDIVIIKASNADEEFIIDLEDLKLIENHTWRINNGSVVNGSNQKLSRILLDLKKGDNKRVRFEDGNNLNYRRNNLQIIECKTKKNQ